MMTFNRLSFAVLVMAGWLLLAGGGLFVRGPSNLDRPSLSSTADRSSPPVVVTSASAPAAGGDLVSLEPLSTTSSTTTTTVAPASASGVATLAFTTSQAVADGERPATDPVIGPSSDGSRPQKVIPLSVYAVDEEDRLKLIALSEWE